MDYFRSFGFEAGKQRYHEEAVYGVALLYNIINSQIAVYLKDFNLTPAKFNTLMIAKHLGGKEGISQVEISKRLIVTASNMTRLLDKLEKEKLVQRLSQAGDRRVNIVRISDKGARLLDKIWPGYEGTLKSLVAGLDKDEQRSLSALVLKWFDRLLGR